MAKGETTEADIKALIKTMWDQKLTPEEQEAAQRCIDSLSDWYSMSFRELFGLIDAEEEARKKNNANSSDAS